MRQAHQFKVKLVQLAAAAAILGNWYYQTGPGEVSPLILPPIPKMVQELLHFFGTSELYSAILVTFKEVFIALALATITGLAVGFVGARSAIRSQVFEPILVWIYQVPMILFYPLFLLWLGFGSSSKIGYAAVSTFFPIAFNSLRAFSSVDPKYVQMGRAFGATPTQLDLSIKFRAGLPLAAAGIRIGTAVCMVTVIVAEMLGSSEGLGYMVHYYAESYNAAKMYASIVIVLMMVGLFYSVVKKLLRENDRAQKH